MSDDEFYPPVAITAAPTDPTSVVAPRPRKGSSPRFAVVNEFVDFTLATIPQTRQGRNELAVWLTLWRLADGDTGIVTAAYATIVERAGCSLSTVKRAVERFRKRGLIECVKQGGWQRGTCHYRVRGVTPSVTAKGHGDRDQGSQRGVSKCHPG